MKIVLIAFLLVAPALAAGADTHDHHELQTSVTADFLAPLAIDSNEEIDPFLRSAELVFSAELDETFTGKVNIAGHSEEEEFHFVLHEGFVSSETLLPNSRFRLGKFLLDIGLMNTLHQHEWPFITAPRVITEFFSPGTGMLETESLADTGFEYSWLSSGGNSEVVVGVTNGRCLGHCEPLPDRPPRPLIYVHPKTSFSIGDSGRSASVGLTYLTREDAAKTETQVMGMDFLIHQGTGDAERWRIQSEIYHEHQAPRAQAINRRIGGYFYPQYSFDHQWKFGVRMDALSNMDHDEFAHAFVPTLTYLSSASAKMRLSYTHEAEEKLLIFQFIVSMGAHQH